MNNELRNLIIDALENITDTDLLDLIYKLLIDSLQETPMG